MIRFQLAGTAVLLAFALSVVPTAGARQAVFPTRIVSLSPTATEDLFAIGAGKQVVAVDSDSNYPADAPHTKLAAYTPNAEAIAGYRPDLVVVAADENGIVQALGKLHVKVIVQAPAVGLSGAYAQLTQLGRVTGRTAGAAKVVTQMKTKIKAIVASVPKHSGLSVYEELSSDYYSATSTTFGGQLLKLLGLKNIADAADKSGSGYPKLSAEYIVAANPDLIVLADTNGGGQSAATLDRRAGWSTIAAVKNNDIVPVSDDIASRWGPRIVDFMQAVATKMRTMHTPA